MPKFDNEEDFPPRRYGAVEIAHDILDMQRELDALRHEVFRLRDIEQKYNDLLMGSINHGRAMIGGILEIAMIPGVLDAIGKHNEGKTT